MEQAMIAVITVIVVALVAFAIVFTNIKRSMTEVGSHKRVAKILSKFADKRGFKCFDHVVVKDTAGTVYVADHVLIGDFGMVLFADVNIGDIVYGEPKAETWKINDDDVAVFLPNPLLELENFTKCMRGSLSKNGIYNVPINSVVVFAQRFTQPELLIGAVPHAMAQGLTKYILQNKLTSSNLGLDTSKILGAMEQITVKAD